MHRLQGKYAQAEAELRQTLEGRRRVQGDEHPDTLLVMRHVLAGRQHALGEENAETISTVAALAQLSRARGDYDTAESLLRKVQEARRRVLTADHPSTLASANDLGVVYLAQRKYEQAQAMFSDALAGRRPYSGPTIPTRWRA